MWSRVSRKDLYDDQSLFSITDETTHPRAETYDLPAELELVEVEVPVDQSEQVEAAQEAEEFDFPLFSFGLDDNKSDKTEGANESKNPSEKDSNGGRLMRVSLREPSYEIPAQKRPESYYFSHYTETDRLKFAASALDYDIILRDISLGPVQGWSKFRGAVLDVTEHNKRVELALQREKRLKKRKPGQKQRLAKKQAIQREKEREEKAKEIKKMIKKKFHKRGGKKNKKKPEVAVPRFRTE